MPWNLVEGDFLDELKTHTIESEEWKDENACDHSYQLIRLMGKWNAKRLEDKIGASGFVHYAFKKGIPINGFALESAHLRGCDPLSFRFYARPCLPLDNPVPVQGTRNDAEKALLKDYVLLRTVDEAIFSKSEEILQFNVESENFIANSVYLLIDKIRKNKGDIEEDKCFDEIYLK